MESLEVKGFPEVISQILQKILSVIYQIKRYYIYNILKTTRFKQYTGKLLNEDNFSLKSRKWRQIEKKCEQMERRK